MSKTLNDLTEEEFKPLRLMIMGIPNVGKSTLFNAITAAGAEASNYPFCTIDPNVGVVAVPDRRLGGLAGAVDQPGEAVKGPVGVRVAVDQVERSGHSPPGARAGR